MFMLFNIKNNLKKCIKRKSETGANSGNAKVR